MTKPVQDIDDLDLSFCPRSKEIELLIGSAAFLKLSYDLGGRQLYIPLKAGVHSPIAVCIGQELAQKISQAYGGLRYEIPTVAGRDFEIMKYYQSGMSQMLIANKMRLNRKTVSNVIDRRLNSAQFDLFTNVK